MRTGKKLLTGMLLVLFIVFVAGCGKVKKNRCRVAGGAQQRHGGSVEIQR